MANMTIVDSTKAYERRLRTQLDGEIVVEDLRRKHEKMAEAPFAFLRATYWRWAETILQVCPSLAGAPPVLAVGDIHLENFGTWRDIEGRLVWGANDFDEAAEMPYVIDLLRLGVSAALGYPDADPEVHICAPILKGYARGLADPHAIVLDQDYAWLRKRTVVSNKERREFWEKIEALTPPKTPPPKRYIEVLRKALPDPKIKMLVSRRAAGAGSLGRPRWVGAGEWNGGRVVREAKAIVPPAWTLVGGRGAKAIRCYEIATGRYRAPDPWYSVSGDIVVRRLSPNNRKIEADKQPSELTSAKMLRAMGRDLAAIHLGIADRRAAIENDLGKRKRNWLVAAGERAAEFVRRDHGEWKRGYKKQKKAREIAP